MMAVRKRDDIKSCVLDRNLSGVKVFRRERVSCIIKRILSLAFRKSYLYVKPLL